MEHKFGSGILAQRVEVKGRVAIACGKVSQEMSMKRIEESKIKK